MTPASYYVEKRAVLRGLELCLKCGKADAKFPYSCCFKCRARQKAMDAKRAGKRVKV